MQGTASFLDMLLATQSDQSLFSNRCLRGELRSWVVINNRKRLKYRIVRGAHLTQFRLNCQIAGCELINVRSMLVLSS